MNSKNEKNNNEKNEKKSNNLKINIMLNKLQMDPSAFNSLIESINKFIISLRLSSERTILSCYTAER